MLRFLNAKQAKTISLQKNNMQMTHIFDTINSHNYVLRLHQRRLCDNKKIQHFMVLWFMLQGTQWAALHQCWLLHCNGFCL